uniref:Uncharacterized protein n=1 Tax=Anguilla anguilla TaxID=7936 RepID=A0A0E9PBI4_ANGAN
MVCMYVLFGFQNNRGMILLLLLLLLFSMYYTSRYFCLL